MNVDPANPFNGEDYVVFRDDFMAFYPIPTKQTIDNWYREVLATKQCRVNELMDITNPTYQQQEELIKLGEEISKLLDCQDSDKLISNGYLNNAHQSNGFEEDNTMKKILLFEHQSHTTTQQQTQILATGKETR